jgi:hypothetical protein
MDAGGRVPLETVTVAAVPRKFAQSRFESYPEEPTSTLLIPFDRFQTKPSKFSEISFESDSGYATAQLRRTPCRGNFHTADNSSGTVSNFPQVDFMAPI